MSPALRPGGRGARTAGALLLLAAALAFLGGVGSSAAADEAPGVYVDRPARRDLVGREFRLVGHVVDAAGQAPGTVRVNGVEVPLKDKKFEASLSPTRDGPYEIRVLYAVVGLPASVVEWRVTADVTPPAVELLEPRKEVTYVTGGEATVSGSAADPNLSEVRMNGRPVALKPGGAFDAVFVVPKGGEVRVEVQAFDSVGNASPAVVRVLTSRAEAGTPAPAPAPSRKATFEVAADGHAVWRSADAAVVDLGVVDAAGPAASIAKAAIALEGAVRREAAASPGAADGSRALRVEVRLARPVPFEVVEPFLAACAEPGVGLPRIAFLPGVEPPRPDAAAAGGVAGAWRVGVTETAGRDPGTWVTQVRAGAMTWTLPRAASVPGKPGPRERASVLGEIATVGKKAGESSPIAEARLTATGPDGLARCEDVTAVVGAIRGAGVSKVVLVAVPPPPPPAPPPAPPAVAPPPAPPASATPAAGPTIGSSAEARLAGWASPEGKDVDAETGYPKRIRRTRDDMGMVLIPGGTYLNV